MIEVLLIVLVVLAVVDIAIGLKIKSQNTKLKLQEIESSISKFEVIIERVEKTIKDEFSRNRIEINEISKTNRDETTETLNAFSEQFSKNVKELNSLLGEKFTELNRQQTELNKQVFSSVKDNRDELSKSLNSFEVKFSDNIKELNDMLRQQFGDFRKQQADISKQAIDGVKAVEQTIEKELEAIRQDNSKQLDNMRKTVDEKLQTALEKRLSESFKQVSERLEQVHKGLGEMKNIANGVGDLKKVLSNVKTRGVLGEYQLENILEQILTPSQYAKNVATKKGSQANVEFAIKLPGKDSDEEVWMPIDSKFPIEDYSMLLDAFEEGDKQKVENAQKLLIKKIESFAKSISEKYIDPPHTTDFGIMFLPVEGLYAEVLRYPGLFETLQRKYKITVTGPTTLSALLNSLQMGFRTLAVQKRSSEVWDILKAVKYEFGQFSSVLLKVHKQINTASTTLETLRTTRTNVLERKLKNVETISASESNNILKLDKNDLNNDVN